MPWPPRQPSREEISEANLAAYDLVIERARRMGNLQAETNAGYYGRLMLSPDLGSRLSEFGRTVRSLGDHAGTYSHKDREFVDQVLSVDFKDNIVQSIHLNDAVATGVRIEAIEALRAGREELLTEEEAQLADFIRKVVGGKMDEATWLKMEGRMGETAVLEYAIFILFLQLTMRLMSCVGIAAVSDEHIEAQIAAFKAGDKPDDFRKRIE